MQFEQKQARGLPRWERNIMEIRHSDGWSNALITKERGWQRWDEYFGGKRCRDGLSENDAIMYKGCFLMICRGRQSSS